MKVLASIDKSRPGNNCYIYEEWSLLMSSFGKSIILFHYMNTYDRKVEIKTHQVHGNFVESEDPEVQYMFEILMKESEQ